MTASMMAAAKTASFQAASGTKGMPVFSVSWCVLLRVGLLADEPAGHGPVVDAEAQHHPEMEADEHEQDAGNDEDVQGEEAGERWASDDRAAEHEIDQRAADEGHAAEDGGADAEAPVGVLIEAQNLAGECHAEGEQKQKDADDPGKFARKLVGAEEKDLHQVDEHDGDHEVGAPTVQGAEKPAELDVVIEEFEAAPRLAGGGRVDQRKQNAGDDLQDQDDGGGAAEDVPPTRGAGGNLVLGRFDGGLCQGRAAARTSCRRRCRVASGLAMSCSSIWVCSMADEHCRRMP